MIIILISTFKLTSNVVGGVGGYQPVNLDKTWKTDKNWAPIVSLAFQKILDILAKEKKIQVTGLVDVKDTQKQVTNLELDNTYFENN